MNEKQFEYLKKTYGKAFTDSIEEYDPSSFKEADFNQRARVNGNQQQNIGRYTRQFIDGVEQEIPVSMRGREIMEGISRVKAGQEAQKVKPEFRVKGTNFLHDVLGYTDEQWEDHQDSGNDHKGNAPATDPDMEAATTRRLNNGKLDKVVKGSLNKMLYPRKNPEDLEEYAEVAGKHMKEIIFPNSERTHMWFKNYIIRQLEVEANQSVGRRTYTKTDNAKYFKDSLYSEWSGNSTSSVSNEEHLIVINDKDRFDPNVSGALIKAARETPNVRQVIAISLTNMIKMSDSDVEAHRNQIINLAKKTVAIIREAKPQFKAAVVQFPNLSKDPDRVFELWTSEAEEQQVEDVKDMISSL
jgi:hypothetical protein